MQNVDVLLIGGGPTGAMLALELAMQNVSFRIIDKEPERFQQEPRTGGTTPHFGTAKPSWHRP